MNTFCSQPSAASGQLYLNKRNNIIRHNDYKVSVKLTENEKMLDKKLEIMKKELIQSYDNNFPYNFPILYDKKLTDSALYHFSEKLPKGADLHVHGSGFMSVPDYIDFMSKNDRVFICCEKGKKYGAVIYADKNETVPKGYIKLLTALDKKIFTGEQLLDIWSLFQSGYVVQSEVWENFEALFDKIDIIENFDSETIRKYYYTAFRKYCENNILHIEFHRTISSDIQEERKMLLIIREAYYDIKKEMPDFSLRIIASGLKKHSREMAEDLKCLEVAKKLQAEIKDDFDRNNVENFIIGYDLVNEEDASRSLLEYSEYLKKYRSRDFNLYLHAGESLNTKNYNLVDAYLLKSKRVGHGYNLYMFPNLLEKYKRADIALEICPVSNIRLGYVSDLRQHPAIEYLKRGVPIVIASDDPIFFENKALTDDWFAVILSFDLTISEIKQLSLNSILYSGVSSREKARLLKVWKRQWQNFVNENCRK